MSRGNDDPDRPDAACTLRTRAAHVRHLITELIFEADRRRLREYAEELEAQATELERGE
jgi:hypothetical protein